MHEEMPINWLSNAAWWILDRAMYRLAEKLVGIGHDVGRVQQMIIGRLLIEHR